MRLYRYIGPERLLAQVVPGGVAPLTSVAALAGWLVAHPEAWREPSTFVVDASGWLRLAPRRSEHVVCAGGEPVLAAGELQLGRASGGRAAIAWASNQSTGYAPEPTSFASLAVAAARVSMEHPDGYEPAFDFRRCERCGQLNLIKDDDWSCAACGAELPRGWNLTLLQEHHLAGDRRHHPGRRLEREPTLVVDPLRGGLVLAPAHAAPEGGVGGAQVGQERSEPGSYEGREAAVEGDEHAGEEVLAVGGGGDRVGEAGGSRGHVRRQRGGQQIDAKTGHHGLGAVASQRRLDQHAGELASVEQEVVRPLEPQATGGHHRSERVVEREADNQRERRQLRGGDGGPEQHGREQGGAGRSDPRSALASAPGGLFVGDGDEALGGAPGGGLADDVLGRGSRGEVGRWGRATAS